MNEKLKKTLRITIGVLLVIVGISGIFIPILPGWLIIFVGIELIGIQIVLLDRVKEYAKKQIEKTKKPK